MKSNRQCSSRFAAVAAGAALCFACFSAAPISAANGPVDAKGRRLLPPIRVTPETKHLFDAAKARLHALQFDPDLDQRLEKVRRELFERIRKLPKQPARTTPKAKSDPGADRKPGSAPAAGRSKWAIPAINRPSSTKPRAKPRVGQRPSSVANMQPRATKPRRTNTLAPSTKPLGKQASKATDHNKPAAANSTAEDRAAVERIIAKLEALLAAQKTGAQQPAAPAPAAPAALEPATKTTPVAAASENGKPDPMPAKSIATTVKPSPARISSASSGDAEPRSQAKKPTTPMPRKPIVSDKPSTKPSPEQPAITPAPRPTATQPTRSAKTSASHVGNPPTRTVRQRCSTAKRRPSLLIRLFFGNSNSRCKNRSRN